MACGSVLTSEPLQQRLPVLAEPQIEQLIDAGQIDAAADCACFFPKLAPSRRGGAAAGASPNLLM